MKTNNLQINNGSICPRKYMEIEVEPTHLTKVIIMMVLRSTQKSVSNIDSYLLWLFPTLIDNLASEK